VRLKVDIIVVAGGPTWVQAVKKATRTIPIVMSGRGLDPVEAGLVESLARPGGNVTGLTLLSRELKTKPSGNKVSHVGAAHAGNTKGTPISRSNRWYVLILHYLMSKKHKRDRAD
jgi:hypothetical protein